MGCLFLIVLRSIFIYLFIYLFKGLLGGLIIISRLKFYILKVFLAEFTDNKIPDSE